jgi:HPt (histidine-containing phosphotransfer) domain-containing protein
MSTSRNAVDLGHLARYTGGDEAINAEILRLFDSQISEMVGRLQAILDSCDTKSWKEVTHTLKGAAPSTWPTRRRSPSRSTRSKIAAMRPWPLLR